MACGCGLWRWLSSLCEVPVEDSPGLRLQLLLEQKEAERQLEKKEAERQKEQADEARAREEAEEQARIEEILRRREKMTPEEKLQDCLSYFESLKQTEVEELPQEVAPPIAEELVEPKAPDVPKGPQGCFEEWLELHFGHGEQSFPSKAFRAPEEIFSDAASLVEVLQQSAEQLSEEAKSAGSFQRLNRLIAELEGTLEEPDPERVQRAKDLHRRHAAVAAELARSLAALDGDGPACAALVALAILAAGTLAEPPWDSRVLPFEAPMYMLSTADVCCALASERCGLLLKDFLLTSRPDWYDWLDWSLLQRTGVAWWVLGKDELDDFLVQRLCQASRERLRLRQRSLGAQGWQLEVRELRELEDEWLFWCIVQGLSLRQLQALLRVPELSGATGMRTLFEHPHVKEPSFLKKNASRLRQIHRYKFAAALFLLAESPDDAAVILAHYCRDSQLMLLALRKHPEARKKCLRGLLDDRPQDPWLQLCVVAHIGEAPAKADSEVKGFATFEGLRLSSSEGLEEATLRLCRKPSNPTQKPTVAESPEASILQSFNW